MRPRDLGALLLLAALWGGSFLFIRLAAPALGPLALMDLRVLLAGGALLVYAAIARRLPAWRSWWRRYLILGALNAAAPFTLIATAELRLTASLAAILNATTPLFTALVAAVWLKERVTAPKAAGLALGVVGVAVLVGWSPLPPSGAVLLSVGASLLAALFYGLGGVYAKVAFGGVPPLALTIGQQMGASVCLLPFAALTLPAIRPAPGVLAAVVALALLCTSLGYLLYFHLIRSVGPTKTLSVTFLVPVFGLLWSTLFLREPVGAGTVAGLAIILASVTLVTGIRVFPGRRAGAPPVPGAGARPGKAR